MKKHKRKLIIALAILTLLLMLFGGLPVKDEEHAIRIAERRVSIKYHLFYRFIMEEDLESLKISAELENGIWIVLYYKAGDHGFIIPGRGTPVVYISKFNGRVLLCKLDGMWI